jgi:hypothetical protein
METLYHDKQVDCRWREKRKSFHLLHKTIYIRVTCGAHVHGLCKHSTARPYIFPPLRKASVPRSSWISKRISLKTLRKLKKPRGKNLSCLALRRKRGFADAKSTAYTFVLSVLLRQPSCLRVDFGRNALARSYLLSSFRVRRNKRGLLSFRPQDEAIIFVSFCYFVQDAFSEACYLLDEAHAGRIQRACPHSRFLGLYLKSLLINKSHDQRSYLSGS